MATGAIAVFVTSGASAPVHVTESDASVEARAERALPSLPPGGGNRIRIRRDADGNLVPGEPDAAEPPSAAERAAAVAMPNHVQAVQRALQRLDPSGAERDFLVRRQQAIVDRVVAEERARKNVGTAVDQGGLTARERSLVDSLAARDRAVREHEMQHYYAGRPYSALPEYWTVRGPDGRDYAVAGIVRFDRTLLPDDPEANLVKLRTLKRSALAPLDPSDHDRRVARELDRLIELLSSEQR